MQGRCDKHLFETAADMCRACGHEFCIECLVYSFGPSQPPFCVPCAVAAAGIRTTAGVRPIRPRKELRRMSRERRREARVPAPPEAPAPAPEVADKPPAPWGVEWPFDVDGSGAAAS